MTDAHVDQVRPGKRLADLIMSLLDACLTLRGSTGNALFCGPNGRPYRLHVINALADNYRQTLWKYLNHKVDRPSFYIANSLWLLSVFEGKALRQRLVDREAYAAMVNHWRTNHDATRAMAVEMLRELIPADELTDQGALSRELHDFAVVAIRHAVLIESPDLRSADDGITLIALRDGASSYDFAFIAGGDATVMLDVQSSIRNSLVKLPNDGTFWERWRVIFHVPVRRSQTITLSIRKRSRSHALASPPFASLTLSEKYQEDCRADFTIVFAAASQANQLWFQVQNNPYASPTWQSELIAIESDVTYAFPLPMKRGSRYCICWSHSPETL